MSPERREILERVARGELSAEEADRLLTDLEEEPPPGPARRDGAIDSINVRADFGAIVIEGDDSVADCEIDGKHTASIEGSTMVIRGDHWTDTTGAGPGPGVFAVNLGRRRTRSHSIRIGDLKGFKGFGFGRDGTYLKIRMNPELSLDVKMDAGSLQISNTSGRVRVRAAAGPVSIEGFEGPLDVSVNAGAVRAVGRLTHGDSRVSSDAGAVKIELSPDSNVEVIAEAALGKVVVPGMTEQSTKRRFGSNCRAVVGNGDGKLRVETAMGSIHVSVKS